MTFTTRRCKVCHSFRSQRLPFIHLISVSTRTSASEFTAEDVKAATANSTAPPTAAKPASKPSLVSAAKPSKSQPTAAPTPNTSTSSAAASASGADDVLHALHTTTEGVERLRTHTLPSINSHIERQTRVLDAVQTERVVTALELVARGKMQRQFKVTYTCVRVYVHSRR